MFLIVFKGFIFLFLVWMFVTQILTPLIRKSTLFPMFRKERAAMEKKYRELQAQIEDAKFAKEVKEKEEELKSVSQ